MELLVEWFSNSSSSIHGLSFNPDGSVVDPVAFQQSILSDSVLMDQLDKTDLEFKKLVEKGDLNVLQEISIECHRQGLRLQRGEVIPSKVEMVKLYVVMEVNDYPLKALVDTTVESSFMPKNYAKHCGIMDLVDGDYKGVIHGVQSGIIGRVHSTPIKIGKQLVQGSFLVLDYPVVDVIFGLDMLSKFQCVINCVHKHLSIFGDRVPLLEGKDVDVEREAKRTKIASGLEEEEEVDEEEDFSEKLDALLELGLEKEKAKVALEKTNRDLFDALAYYRREWNLF